MPTATEEAASSAPESAPAAVVSKPQQADASGSQSGGDIRSTEPSSSSSMDAVVEQEAPALLREAEERLAALYAVHDFFFSAQKGEKQAMLRTARDKVLATLASFGEGSTARERARVCLLKGKALDAMERFDPEAEAALTRAVKLEPSDVQGWTALGHVFWKKGDLAAARDCLLQGLARRPSKEALRMLSMILRQLPQNASPAPAPAPASSAAAAPTGGGGGLPPQGQGPPDPAAAPSKPSTTDVVGESVRRAKEAVALDVGDPMSWYVLGNAYVALFFSRSHAPQDLERALSAYQKAEANGGGANPDLHFNLAQVRSYREEFALAAAALHRAADLDPALPVQGHVRAMERRVARTVELLGKRGKVKEKRLQALVSALKHEDEGKKVEGALASLERVTLGDLREGPNPGKLLALKLVLPLGQLTEPPCSFLVIDAAGECGVLSVYHLGMEAARRLDKADGTSFSSAGTSLLVVSPYVKRVQGPPSTGTGAGEEEGAASYRAVQILDPLSLLVGGRPVHPSDLAPARVKMEAFDG